MRWTVDTAKDLKFVSKIFSKLYSSKEIFHMEDVVRLWKDNPELLEINEGIPSNEALARSL